MQTPWQRALNARQRRFQRAAQQMAREIARTNAALMSQPIPQTWTEARTARRQSEDHTVAPYYPNDDWLDERYYPHDVSVDQMRLDASDKELEKWDDFVAELRQKKK